MIKHEANALRHSEAAKVGILTLMDTKQKFVERINFIKLTHSQ